MVSAGPHKLVSSISARSITWKLTGDANSEATLEIPSFITSRGGTQLVSLNGPLGKTTLPN